MIFEFVVYVFLMVMVGCLFVYLLFVCFVSADEFIATVISLFEYQEL